MSKIKCKCNDVFEEKDFPSHFGSCSNFKQYFKQFDFQFGDILKKYTEDDKENLFILRILLQQYTRIIEKKIKQK
jgi:hypothetical protein